MRARASERDDGERGREGGGGVGTRVCIILLPGRVVIARCCFGEALYLGTGTYSSEATQHAGATHIAHHTHCCWGYSRRVSRRFATEAEPSMVSRGIGDA